MSGRGTSRGVRRAATIAAVSCLTFGMMPLSPTVQALQPASRISDVKERLTAASRQVIGARDRVETADDQLAKSRKALSAAESALATSRREELEAQQRLETAKDKVAKQQAEITRMQAKIAAMQAVIDEWARNSYIEGQTYESLAVVMGEANAGDVLTAEKVRDRVAEENTNTLDALNAAKAALAEQLKVLEGLEAQARSEEQQAEAARLRAREAVVAAESAKARIAKLLRSRQSDLAQAARAKSKLQKTYQELLAEQRARAAGAGDYAAGSGGYTGTIGTGRSARAAVAWALGMVGGGLYYDGLCLGFVDDAYQARGARQAWAIHQWDVALAAGYGHPGDRTPPIGAQVFWMSGNPARHIAIYIGNGMVVSTGVDNDHVGVVSMEYMDGYGPYIGWATPYYS